MVALLAQEEVIEDGEQLEPGGFNAVVLPFADEVREAKAPEGGYVKAESKKWRSTPAPSSFPRLILYTSKSVFESAQKSPNIFLHHLRSDVSH